MTTRTSSLKSRTSPPGTIQHFKGVLFGPPGTGKTTAACSGKGTLLIEMEPEGDMVHTLKGRTDIDVIKPTSGTEIGDIIRSLLTTDRTTWNNIVFDSITFMPEVVGGGDIQRAVIADKDPRRAFLKTGTLVNQLVYDAVQLPMNVVFTSQIQSMNDKEDGAALDPEVGEYPLSLAVQPMIYKLLAPAVSFMGRTYKRTEYEDAKVQGQPRNKVTGYFVSFDDGNRSPAKSRVGLPPVVKNFNLDAITKLVKKEASNASNTTTN